MNKLALITGGTKGIGRAITERFAAEGFDVIITARTQVDLGELKLEIEEKYSVNCLVFAVDMGEKQAVLLFAKEVLSLNRNVDVLINNAGMYRAGLFQDEPDGTLEQLMQINVHGPYYLTQKLLPQFVCRKSGHIFNICSVASISTPANSGSYTITKFALLGFTKVLRQEMIAHNVRVTAVLPGSTLTDSWTGENVPAGRLMPPADIAESIWSAYSLKNSVVEEIVLRPVAGDFS